MACVSLEGIREHLKRDRLMWLEENRGRCGQQSMRDRVCRSMARGLPEEGGRGVGVRRARLIGSQSREQRSEPRATVLRDEGGRR